MSYKDLWKATAIEEKEMSNEAKPRWTVRKLAHLDLYDLQLDDDRHIPASMAKDAAEYWKDYLNDLEAKAKLADDAVGLAKWMMLYPIQSPAAVDWLARYDAISPIEEIVSGDDCEETR